MHFSLTISRERRLQQLWDAKTPRERLELVMQNEDLFWALELVTEAELKVLYATSPSNRLYVLQREVQPFFTSININQPLENQVHAEKLKAALNAVFYKHSALTV